MPWSDKELQALATAHFQGRTPKCPACGARVHGKLHRFLGQKTGLLQLWCDRCGESGSFSEPHVEAMQLEWTQRQLQDIEDAYFEHGYAACPNDGSRIELRKTNFLGSRVPLIHGACPRCGRQFSNGMIKREKPSSPFEEKYESIREIGKGGMGVVSLVRNKVTGAEFAAKRILPEYLRDAQIVRRFQREERLLRSVTHKHVVPLVDAFLDESGGVLVMEFMKNGDLEKAITNEAVTGAQLAELFAGAVEGVKFLHQEGIIHRDLKPGNILVDNDFQARVSDFGLAVLEIRDTTPLTGGFVGTPHYAAPEQASAATVDAKADVYALALLAHEIVLRETPWTQPLGTSGDALFDAVLKSALCRDPAKRLGDPGKLVDEVRRLAEAKRGAAS